MKNSSFTRFIIAFVIGVIIPVFSFTIYQLSQQSKDEKLIKSSYERQLSSILFSVNQHCYDTVNAWVMTFLDSLTANSPARYEKTLQLLTNQNLSVVGTLLKTTDNHYIQKWKNGTFDILASEFQDSVKVQITQKLDNFSLS
ncbi:hypothetical protein JW935_07580, partial [candidate division KSB1 bacterium]|nr:hypothetical protein [candidate division KSB1 bacterium]